MAYVEHSVLKRPPRRGRCGELRHAGEFYGEPLPGFQELLPLRSDLHTTPPSGTNSASLAPGPHIVNPAQILVMNVSLGNSRAAGAAHKLDNSCGAFVLPLFDGC